MKKRRIEMTLKLLGLRFGFALAFMVFMGFSAFAQTVQVKGTAAEKIVAKVDSYIILKSDLESAYLQALSEGRVTSRDGRCKVLEELIIEKVLVAKAEIDSIEVSDEQVWNEVDTRMKIMLSNLGGNESMVERQFGKPYAQIRTELFPEIREQELAEAMERKIYENIKVTPAEVRRFFNRISRDSLPFYDAEVTIGIIEKKPQTGRLRREEIRAQMNRIRERIVSGDATFADMAREYSMDGTAARGGNLGFFKRGELDPTYEATAMKMKVGEISPVIETSFGFHIIELLERRGNQFNTNHIIIVPEPSAEDVQKMVHFLDSIRSEIVAGNVSFEAMAKEHSDDKMAGSSGGFMMDRMGSRRLSVRDLDPMLFFAIDTMKISNITPAITFRKEDGSESVRLIYYQSRISPHQANLDQDYEKIYLAALNQKRIQKRIEWFQEARKEIFIDVAEEYRNCGFLQNQ
jgi:peptidyl-prolyl cis-trans isomerase SurA